MFKFFIDGTEYDAPDNWQEFTETIEFSEEEFIIALKYDIKLNFNGEAYDYLYTKKQIEGFCYVAEFKIHQQICDTENYKQIFKGKLILSDCRFHINKCWVECSIEDDSYGALIFNNKSIPANLEAGSAPSYSKSKNGEILNLTYNNTANYLNNSTYLFNPADGSTLADGVGFIVFPHDAFNYIINWMTDKQVEFYSDYLDYSLPVTTDLEKVRYLSMVKGYALRNRASGFGGPEILQLSFIDLFNEINKKYPLRMSIEFNTTTGKPILRIEDFDSLRQDTESIQLNNIADIQEFIDNARLFSRITIGSNAAPYDSTINSYPPTKELTHIKESYFLQGQCNIDKELNLFGEYITDTNTIEELLVTNTSNDTFDDNVFFLEVVVTGTPNIYEAIKTANYNDATKFHYNDNLLNRNVVARNNLASNVAINTGVGLDLEAHGQTNGYGNYGTQSDTAGVSMPPTQIGAYYQVGFLTNNPAVFNASIYTALVAGSYTFESYVYFRVGNTFSNRSFVINYKCERFNSLNVLQETQQIQDGPYTTGGYHISTLLSTTFIMSAGDYIKYSASYDSHPVDFTQNSTMLLTSVSTFSEFGNFATGSTPNTSGVVSNNSTLSYFGNRFIFDYPLSIENYEQLKDNLLYYISFNVGSIIKKAWTKKIVRRLSTGETNFELISTIEDTN